MKKFTVPDGWIDDEDPVYVEKQKIKQARLKTEHDLEAAKEKTTIDKAKADSLATAKAEAETTQHNTDAAAKAANDAAKKKTAAGPYPAGSAAGPYPADFAGPYPAGYAGPFPAGYAGPFPAGYSGPHPTGYVADKAAVKAVKG